MHDFFTGPRDLWSHVGSKGVAEGWGFTEDRLLLEVKDLEISFCFFPLMKWALTWSKL